MVSVRRVVVATLSIVLLLLVAGCGSSRKTAASDASGGDISGTDGQDGNLGTQDLVDAATTDSNGTADQNGGLGDTSPDDARADDLLGADGTLPDTTLPDSLAVDAVDDTAGVDALGDDALADTLDSTGGDTSGTTGTLPAPKKVIVDPGLGSGIRFAEIVGQLSDKGAVVLNATLTGTGVTLQNSRAVVSDQSGTTTVVLRQGDPMPTNPPGGSVEYFHRVVANDSELLVGMTTPTFSGVSTLVVGPLFELIGTEFTSPAPDTTDYYQSFESLRLNPSGYVAFYAHLSGENQSPACTTCTGIFGGVGAKIAPIVLRGDPAPGLDALVLIGFYSKGLALNRNGEVAFLAYLKGPGVTNANEVAIYFGTAGKLALVAREGQSADGTTLGNLGYPSINAAGQLVFYSADAVWLWTANDGLKRVLKVGDAVTGGTISRIYDRPQLSAGGRIIVDAEIDDDPAVVLWDQGAKVIARVGEPAPGIPGAPLLAALVGPYLLNAKGQVAFGGVLETDDVEITTENRDCLWITDTSGTPKLVMRTEGTLALAPGELHQVGIFNLSESDGDILDFQPRESGYPSSFDDNGELGVVVQFLDGLLAYVVMQVN